MEIERTIKYSDGGMATGLVGEDQVKDLSFKIRVKEMPKSDTISLHEVVTIEPFDLGDEKNIVFSPFHMIFGDSSLAIFDALGVDEVAGLKREDCVEFLENLKKQGKTERDGSFIAGLCNFSGNNVFMFFNVQRLNFKGFASRVLPHEALHLARILITLRENKWVRENLTTPEWYLDPRGTFVDMNDNNEEFFAETLERTSAIAMDAWQRITGEKCYMDGGGIEDETKEVSDEHINSIIEDISDYKVYGSAEGNVDAETITFYGDYNEEDKNYNIEIVFKVDDPYADYEYVTDDPDETEKMVLPSYHLQSIILIEDDMYNIQLTESQKEKISEAIESQFNNKIAAAYDYAMKMDAYESQDETGRMEMPRKYFMKNGGGVDDVKKFVATKEGIIEIYSGSDARSAEVKVGDVFLVTEEMKNGIYYLGKLNIKGSFKLSAGLSGKDVNKMNFGKQDEILYLLRKENIGGNSNFFAQFKKHNKMKNGGDIHDLYQIIIYNRFGDEMHSYIIGDYEKATENLKEDLKLAETGSRVDISHNGEVIYSETKKQYKNGGGIEAKNGAIISWDEATEGDSAFVVDENKTGLIIKAYGRRFHLKFADGTAKTYSANELVFYNFEKNEEMEKEYKHGGGVGDIQREKVTASSIKSKKHPFTFTFDDAYRKGNIVVQRIGGSDMWNVGIDGKPAGRVLGAQTQESAFNKAEKIKYKNGGGVGMAMEGIFLDDEFERMVEKLKNYLAKYPYIWTRGTKRYVPIEGWQYAAALMGLSSRVKNVNEIQPGVWQAEADVVDKRSGVVNCSGFAIVNKAEHKWAKKNEDIINFVQTRAVSRALRNCISYLIKAAGYSTTPAEEMYGLASEEKKKKGMPSSIKPVKGVSEDDFIFDRPEYNEGMTQPPFPKEEVPITKYVPREEIPQEDMLRKVWAESKANGIVIRSVEFMNEIELALTDETIGNETQIKSLLMESYNWLTENGMVLRSKIFMKKFKDSL